MSKITFENQTTQTFSELIYGSMSYNIRFCFCFWSDSPRLGESRPASPEIPLAKRLRSALKVVPRAVSVDRALEFFPAFDRQERQINARTVESGSRMPGSGTGRLASGLETHPMQQQPGRRESDQVKDGRESSAGQTGRCFQDGPSEHVEQAFDRRG
ncbi:hypothetical protein RvY_11773 [Ramazzottius varieornatus]|uniref:Uncharacterized protein n=1 Tax=Ramazzottius varieornatus TaxID=947166 RepID=A0A1D1VJM2_RAMVA|nr:hypothetical protein RvY_11773 [Ramazzottius varieornatus]